MTGEPYAILPQSRNRLYDTMSQSWKGEFMDFFTEAVNVLANIVRALSCPDFPEEWKEMFPVKVREAAILPMRIRRLWPSIRGAGKLQAGTGHDGITK